MPSHDGEEGPGPQKPATLLQKSCDRFSGFAVSRPWALLAIGLALTLVLLAPSFAPFKNIKTDFAALLPEDQPSVILLEDVGRRFGSIKNLEIVFETARKEAIPGLFRELAERIAKVPGVAKVRYEKPGYRFFKKNKLLYLGIDELRELRDEIDKRVQREKLGPMYLDFESEAEKGGKAPLKSLSEKASFVFGSNPESPYLANADESVFIFEVFPEPKAGGNVGESRKFFAEILKFMRDFDPRRFDPGIRVSYGGGVKGVVNEYNSIVKDVAMSGVISWVLLLVFLGSYYRNLVLTGANFIPLFAGMVWAFGITGFMIGQLNMITAFLFAVLSGLGIETGIHLTTRYFEERRNLLAPRQACAVMLESTGRPAFVAVITTMCTMLVLLISDFRGFSEFGSIMAVGIFMIFCAYVLLLPPLLVLLEKWRIVKTVDAVATHMIDPFFFMKRWTQMRYVAPILAASLLLSGVSVWALFSEVKFNNNFESLKAVNREEREVTGKTDAIYGAKSFPALVSVDNLEEAREVKRALEAYVGTDKTPTVGQVLTLDALVPDDQDEKLDVIRSIRESLDDPLVQDAELDVKTRERLEDLRESVDVKPFLLADVPRELQSLFYGLNNEGERQFVFVLPSGNLDLEDGDDSIAFAADTRDIETGGKTFHAVSHNLVFADLLIMLTRDMKVVILFAILAAFVLLWVDFKRIFTAALVILPLITGMLWTFCVMWVADLDLNLFNIVVFPCLIGMSIDNATHIFYRTREHGIENMVQVLRLTGNAVVMSVITTVTGFVGLIAAHNRGLHSTGVLAVVGLVTTMASGLVFFPALLQFLRTKKVPF